MSEETKEQPAADNNADIQKEVAIAHSRASGHFNNSKNDINSPTYQELHAQGQRAAEIAQDLHNRIAQSTSARPAAEVMRNDADNAKKTQQQITQGTDPLAAYTGYSAYAVLEPAEKDGNRNYYDNPLTYDEYAVSEDKKGLNVKYNLTELTPGGKAGAANDPNLILGGSSTEQSFSYNEKTSGNKTIVTTEHILTGTHSPSSIDINENRTQPMGFQNKQNHTCVYDKDKKLVEQTYRTVTNNTITDAKSSAHKGQDMSRGNEQGYFQKRVEASAVRGQYSRFNQTELSRDGKEQKVLSGWKNEHSEKYNCQQGNTLNEAVYSKNAKGDWVYSGSQNQTDGENIVSHREYSPEEAEKEFKRLKQSVNKELKELTGTNNLDAYADQLGAAKPQADLGALWSNINATQEDKAKAEQANAEFSGKYENAPAAIVALKKAKSR